jgi:hypothetical protein
MIWFISLLKGYFAKILFDPSITWIDNVITSFGMKMQAKAQAVWPVSKE